MSHQLLHLPKGGQGSNYGLLTSFEIRTGDSGDDSRYYTFEDEEIRRKQWQQRLFF